jgi:uncharacterized protein (UPF0147 family)
MPPRKILKDYDDRFHQATSILTIISDDTTTPRNIRRAAKEALNFLLSSDEGHAVRAAQAVHILEDISQDPNMPAYTRTRIWNVVSILENIKG